MGRARVQWLVKRPPVNNSVTLQGAGRLQTGVTGAHTSPRTPSTVLLVKGTGGTLKAQGTRRAHDTRWGIRIEREREQWAVRTADGDKS